MNATGKLIAFGGSTPNIGTTVAALGAAYHIAARTGKRVGFLCLNLKSAKTHLYLGVDKPKATLDALRPELTAGTLTADKLRGYAYAPPGLPGLHVLFGNLPRDQAEYYEPEQLSRLLAAAREAYDLTVADVSAYWDNAATICAMREADIRCLTTTARFSHFQEDVHRWAEQVGSQFGLAPAHFRMVVLHGADRTTGGFGMKEIRKEAGPMKFSELKLLESIHLQLDSGRLDEWLAAQERGGAGAYEELTGSLLRQLQWEERFKRIQRPWYQRLLRHKGARR